MDEGLSESAVEFNKVKVNEPEAERYMKLPGGELVAKCYHTFGGANNLTVAAYGVPWGAAYVTRIVRGKGGDYYLGTVSDQKYFLLVIISGDIGERRCDCRMYQHEVPGKSLLEEVGSWTAEEV